MHSLPGTRPAARAPHAPKCHTAGDEEVQYILVEVDNEIGKAHLQPGKPLQLQGLDTDAPTLSLGPGIRLQGTYEGAMGSVMVFEKAQDGQGQPEAKYVCHTDKKLKFHQAQ